MQDNVGNFYILNNLVESEKHKLVIDCDKNIFYEVIRIIEGVPLFFEDHYLRLKSSMNALKLELKFSKQDLKTSIKSLLEANGNFNCNVKINVFCTDSEQNCLAYISSSYYPPSDVVERGVALSLLDWERNNPNVKIVNSLYREAVNRKITETGAFEVLLVNATGKVTEGSRSNVFFIKGSRVFTAPGEYVLKGITRQYIIDVCKRLDLEVIETLVKKESLNEMEGLFISGTSIKVLPVSSIDNHNYASGTHNTIVDIRNQFDKLIDDHVSRNRE